MKLGNFPICFLPICSNPGLAFFVNIRKNAEVQDFGVPSGSHIYDYDISIEALRILK